MLWQPYRSKSTKFSIEWIYGEFRIARLEQGICVDYWFAPYPVNNLADINQAMLDASEHIDLSRGGDIAIAYEDDLHTHEFIEVPQMPRRDLEKHLQRRVQRNKPFEDEAAWCFHSVNHNTENQGVLLHRMPKRIVDAIIRICEEYHLLPRRLVPLSEVMSEHIKTMDVDPDETLMLAAMFKHHVEILVSKGNGDILFVRELTFSWEKDDADRLTREINRTIGYAKQRISSHLSCVWVLGEHAPMLIDQFEVHLIAPVALDEPGTKPTFWMSKVASLPNRLSSNFIPPLARRAITRKTALQTTIMAAIVLASGALIIFVSIETIIAKHGIDNHKVKQEIFDLNEKIEQLEKQLYEIDLTTQRLNQLTADAFNLPAIFLNHLGSLLPDNIKLTRADINRVDNYWRVELTGASHLPLDQLPMILTQLETRLANDPWNLSITQSWQTSWMQQLQNGGALDQTQIGFEIKGELR